MKIKPIHYAIGGFLTILTGYLVFDLIKGNQVKQKKKSDKQKDVTTSSISNQESSSTAKKDSNDAFPLKVGSFGAKVVVLQLALNSLGESLDPDGRFGNMTYDAIYNQSGGFGGLNFLCGMNYQCTLTYNNWESIMNSAKANGFDEDNAWTRAKQNWNL